MGKRKIITTAALLLTLSAAGAASVPAASGANQHSAPRIFSGLPASPGQFPAIAALVDSWEPQSYQGQFCAAVLIRPLWLLTAAHCLQYRRPADIDAVIGRQDLSRPGGQRLAVRQFYIHPKYQRKTLTHDLALLRLAQPAQGIKSLRPIYPRAQINPGQRLQVAGWGMTEYQSAPVQLLQTAVRAISQQNCRRIYDADSSMFCAAAPGRDACYGDSGGPIIGQLAGREALFGLVSYGRGCARDQYPGVYSRVSIARKWINKQVRARPSKPWRRPGKERFPIPPVADYGPLNYIELSEGREDGRYQQTNYYWQLSFAPRKRYPLSKVAISFTPDELVVCNFEFSADCNHRQWLLTSDLQRRRLNFSFYTDQRCFQYQLRFQLRSGKTFPFVGESCQS